MSQHKQEAIREGKELRSALAAAFASSTPNSFDNILLNKLLDYAKLPRDHPQKDPLELKQTLAAFDPSLGKLSLKQRKAMTVALENQLEQAKRLNLPEYFFVEGGWPPKQPEPEPPRAPPKAGERAVVVSATPLSGEGDGFTWTQTEVELTITIDVPPGTQQQEIMMQLSPRLGPADQIALRAKFWPFPLISGTLHYEIEASEAMWHLESNSRVVIDLPKVEERLWPGTPPVFASGAGPLTDYQIPNALPAPSNAAADDELEVVATGSSGSGSSGSGGADANNNNSNNGSGGSGGGSSASSALAVSGIAPEAVVQKMGQRPNELETQLKGCSVLTSLIVADAGKALGAAQARAIPVLVRLLRLNGHLADVQLAAWACLVHLVEAQPFLRKPLSDLDAVRLALSAIDAHKQSEAVLTQLAIAIRLLLPATPPRPFVEAGGLELLVESIRQHKGSVPLAESAGECLARLSAVNNIVRRMVLRMEVLEPLLTLCESHPTRSEIHHTVGTLLSELSKGDLPCTQMLHMQASAPGVVKLMGRFKGSDALQADGARALAVLLKAGGGRAALSFAGEGGLEVMSGAVEVHGEDSAVGEEVSNALESAAVALCEAAEEEPPEEDLDVAGLVELIRTMVGEAEERARLKKAADAEKEAARRKKAAEAEEAEKEKRGEEEAAAPPAPSQYSGFSWGASSFDDPRLKELRLEDAESAPQEPRIVELDMD